MWQKRLKLGTYFRIGVYVHWSFGLLVAYVAYAGFEDGLIGMLFALTLLVGMFFCVTLHEYGHALTARQFGIETLDITLFPIGGVARLMKIPRIPWQELVVAVAGPAVNVVIIVMLTFVLLFVPGIGVPSFKEFMSDELVAERFFERMNSPSILGFMMALFVVNTLLILFNMIPAFPMDGGRVLRSLLAMAFEYRRATRIASRIGIVCAVAMGAIALHYGQFTAGLIAVFICYAGLAEARQVEAIEPLRHISVGHAMIPRPPFIEMQTPLGEMPESLRFCPFAAIPVVGPGGVVVGMLAIADVIDALRQGAEPSVTAGEIARHDVPILFPEETLESVVTRPLEGHRQFAVVSPEGHLVGLLDLDTSRTELMV